MNIKTQPFKLFAAILLFAVTIAPLWAQTNTPDDLTNTAATNAPVTPIIETTGTHAGISTHNNNLLSPAILAMLTPIVAIVMVCGFLIIFAGLNLYFRHRKNMVLHETVRVMIEKGVPIPPEMFQKTERHVTEPNKPDEPDRKDTGKDLRIGLLLLGLGTGIVLLCGRPGWIVFFLGVAFMLIWLLDTRKGDKNNHDQPTK